MALFLKNILVEQRYSKSSDASINVTKFFLNTVVYNWNKTLVHKPYVNEVTLTGHNLYQKSFESSQLKLSLLNSRFSKFTMGIWHCEWRWGQNFETAAQKIIIWKFWGNIFTVCFYFDRQMTVRIIEPQFKKEREFQKFIKKIFTQPNCHCKHRKIWV